MDKKESSIKEKDIKAYLNNHLNNHWKDIVNAVANSNNGSNIFIKTFPCKDTINDNIEGELPHVTLVLLSHNKSVYICYTDDKLGVYKKLQNIENDKIFFAATDDNKIYGDHLFGKNNGTKIYSSIKENEDNDIDYLNVNWLTGEAV